MSLIAQRIELSNEWVLCQSLLTIFFFSLHDLVAKRVVLQKKKRSKAMIHVGSYANAYCHFISTDSWKTVMSPEITTFCTKFKNTHFSKYYFYTWVRAARICCVVGRWVIKKHLLFFSMTLFQLWIYACSLSMYGLCFVISNQR